MQRTLSCDFARNRDKLNEYIASYLMLDDETRAELHEFHDKGLMSTLFSQEVFDNARQFNSLLKNYVGVSIHSSDPINELHRSIRIYADGVFDLTHSGHFNAMRQSRALGDILVVGVVSDEEATKTKGIPVYNQEERAELMRACKWVDEVVVGVPYEVKLSLIKQVGCDFVAHGDDFAPTADGTDSYSEPRAAGIMKIFRRTEGVSTTDLVSRMLLLSKLRTNPKVNRIATPLRISEWIDQQEKVVETSTSPNTLLMSTKRLSQFFSNRKIAKPADRIVYIDGSFDVLHVGHVRALKKAKENGDFLIVGLHDDSTIEKYKGTGYPLMNLLERTLSILAMRDVDEVIIGAPWIITEYLIKSYKVDVVIVGSQDIQDDNENKAIKIEQDNERYEVPRNMNKFIRIDSGSNLNTDRIVARIVSNRQSLTDSIEKRKKKQDTHYAGIVQGTQEEVLEI